MENEFSNRISVKNIVLAGMFAAFLAVMSQVSLPMPTGVPITVQECLPSSLLYHKQSYQSLLSSSPL